MFTGVLSLSPPPLPVFPVYNLTRSPTYRRALLSERLEQAIERLTLRTSAREASVPMEHVVPNIIFSFNLFGSLNCLVISFVIDQDYLWFGLGFTNFLQRVVFPQII